MFSDIMESLNTHYRIISSYQNTPRTYGTDDLLYQNDVHTIQMIGDYPGMSLNELAEKTYRTKSAMSVLIKALAKNKLVKRKRDEDDNRRYIITLTEKGQVIYDYHKRLDAENYEELLVNMNCYEKITIEKLKATFEVLENLNKVLHIRLDNKYT